MMTLLKQIEDIHYSCNTFFLYDFVLATFYSKRPSGQSTNVSGHCQQKVTYRLCTLIIPLLFFITAQWDFLCAWNRGEMKLIYCKHNPKCKVATVCRLATRSLAVVVVTLEHLYILKMYFSNV